MGDCMVTKNKIIAIIGCPAIGKTLLCNKIKERTGWTLLNEYDTLPDEMVELLNTKPNNLITQLWFRNQRVDTILKAEEAKKISNVIIDTFFITSVPNFMELENEFEREIGLKIAYQDNMLLPWPDVIIGLTCSEHKLYSNFCKREEQYEKYPKIFQRFVKINDLHTQLYKKYNRIIVVNTDDLDFYRYKDVDKIIAMIEDEL